MTSATQPAPTPRQLRYLRGLAARTGTTFSNPATRNQASREIDRLRLVGAAPRDEWQQHREDTPQYATAVTAEEVSGYGASATWRSAAPPTRAPAERRGERLATYEIGTGRRILEGERSGGLIRIIDRAEDGPGDTYVVEEGVELDGLAALLRDYVAQARLLDEVPMARPAVHELLSVCADV